MCGYLQTIIRAHQATIGFTALETMPPTDQTPLNGDKDNAKAKRRGPRQYHYVYGSILPDDGGDDENNHNDISLDTAGEGAITSDQDSLIGESLIPTDDEGGGMSSQQADFPHLLLTSNGRRPRLLSKNLPGPNGATSRKRNKQWFALQRSHPVLFAVLVIVTTLLVAGLVAVVFFPNSAVAQTAAKAATGAELPYPVPWPRVHRASYNDTIEDYIDMTLWDPAMVKNDGRSFLSFPLPTGAFWTNLVLKTTKDDTTGLSYPVAVYPYAYQWSAKELQLSYPRQHRRTTATEIHDDFVADLRLSTVEPTNRRYVAAFDPLSVTLRYEMDNKGSLTAFLVQGSPYWTIEFSNVAPVLTAATSFAAVSCPKDADLASLVVIDGSSSSSSETGKRHRQLRYGVCTQNDKSTSGLTTLQGVQFVLQTQEGLVWYIFASEPLTWEFDTTSRRTLTATDSFTGVLRIALVPTNTMPSPTSGSSSSSSSQTLDSADSYFKSTGLARLIYHAGIYPTGGSVGWSFTSTSGSGSSSSSGSSGKSTSAAVLLASKTVTEIAQSVSSEFFSGGNSTNTTTSSNSVDVSPPPSDRVATLTFKYDVQTFTQGSSAATQQKKLLMLALPHHARNLPPSSLLGSDSFDLVFECVKGALKPVLGSTWSYNIALPTFGLDGDRGATGNIGAVLQQSSVRTALLANLQKDVKLALPTHTENIYGYGKQTARLAQLLHVGMKLRQAVPVPTNGNNTTNTTSNRSTFVWTASQSKALNSTIDQAQSRLKDALVLLLSRNISDSLVFDQDFGGIVSVDGLRDPQADFGNGRYNDHHFHYGYIVCEFFLKFPFDIVLALTNRCFLVSQLYASAILASVDKHFFNEYSQKIDAIMYDIAYQGNFVSTRKRTTGPFFPGARYKSWFDGHSFASGLFPQADGKSQESSSEAVNGYYGVYLWSLARNEALASPSTDISADTDFARLLLATEITGAKTYWQMLPPVVPNSTLSNGNKTSAGPTVQPLQRGVYNSQFASNLMVGNVGMLDVVCRTWFGKELLYVHLINFLPVTSATGELFTSAYATQEYQSVLKTLEADPAWVGFVIANHAISDPNAAWTDALTVSSPELDVGLSKSQLLYWVATRKGFSAGSSTSSDDQFTKDSDLASDSPPESQSKSPASTSSGGSCSTNPKCAALGLIGSCCPTPTGQSLGK